MTTSRTVLVAGCGYVGNALGERLVEDGLCVVGMRRHPERITSAFQVVGADMTDAASLAAIPRGITDVVITASPGGGDDACYVAAYVHGPELLLTFLRRRGDEVARVILTTSTGVYAQGGGVWVDESSETAPTHHSGKRMLEGEALIESLAEQSSAVRLAGIYGPGRTRLIDSVKNGTARTPRRDHFTNRIHRDDCAGVLRHLLLADMLPPRIVGVDQEPATLADVHGFLAATLGAPVPPVEDEDEKAATGRPARGNKRCASAILGPSGYIFAYPTYREGYGAMLSEVRS